MKHKLFIVSLSLAILLGSCATVLPRRVENFNGDWTFHLGEVVEASLPEFDDTGWRKLNLPTIGLSKVNLAKVIHPEAEEVLCRVASGGIGSHFQ